MKFFLNVMGFFRNQVGYLQKITFNTRFTSLGFSFTENCYVQVFNYPNGGDKGTCAGIFEQRGHKIKFFSMRLTYRVGAKEGWHMKDVHQLHGTQKNNGEESILSPSH